MKYPAAPSCADNVVSRGSIRLQRLQLIGPAHADHESRAARAGNANRTTQVDIVGRQRERIEHGEPLAIVQLATHRRSRLTDGDATIVSLAAHIDLDDAGFRFRRHAVRCATRRRDST